MLRGTAELPRRAVALFDGADGTDVRDEIDIFDDSIYSPL
jgi:hypothetical protein